MNAAIDEVVVLSGASRGLGAALAARLLSPSRRLICVARSPNPELAERARVIGAPLDYRRCDLSDPQASARLAEALGEDLREQHACARYVLINNAGTVEPIGRVEAIAPGPLAAALQVNLAAAMLLSASFLAATESLLADRRILNISSGAARHPVAGWAVYCSAKAALDMFSRCIGTEQAGRANPVRVCSLAPGVLDTDMQSVIRSADPAGFPAQPRFLELKAKGALATPGEVAGRILALLASEDFGVREIDDIRAR